MHDVIGANNFNDYYLGTTSMIILKQETLDQNVFEHIITIRTIKRRWKNSRMDQERKT